MVNVSTRAAGLAFALLAAALLAPARAEAQATAKELYQHAQAAYDLAKYNDAASLFEQVYEQRPDQKVLLYNIAQAYRLGNNSDKALFFYRQYLKFAPTAKNRPEVEQRIGELERALSEQRRGPNEPAPLPDGLAHNRRPPPPPPPRHEVVAPPPVTPPPVATPVEPQPVETHEATIVETHEEPPPGSETTATPVYKKWWLWAIVGGVIVAGAVVGVIAATSGGQTFTGSLGQIGPGSALLSF